VVPASYAIWPTIVGTGPPNSLPLLFVTSFALTFLLSSYVPSTLERQKPLRRSTSGLTARPHSQSVSFGSIGKRFDSRLLGAKIWRSDSFPHKVPKFKWAIIIHQLPNYQNYVGLA